MSYLKKEDTLIKRDENGNLIPVEITLELLPDKPLVKITPMLKGELQRLYSLSEEEKAKCDDELIIKHCHEPKYNSEELRFIDLKVYNALVTAILSLSLGVTQEEIKNASVKTLISELDAKKKKE